MHVILRVSVCDPLDVVPLLKGCRQDRQELPIFWQKLHTSDNPLCTGGGSARICGRLLNFFCSLSSTFSSFPSLAAPMAFPSFPLTFVLPTHHHPITFICSIVFSFLSFLPAAASPHEKSEPPTAWQQLGWAHLLSSHCWRWAGPDGAPLHCGCQGGPTGAVATAGTRPGPAG